MFESCRDRHIERPAIKGFLAVSAFVLSAFSCCKALQLSSSEFNELPRATIHSMQHGRNTAVRFPFSRDRRYWPIWIWADLSLIYLKGFSPLRTNRDRHESESPATGAGLIANIILQEKNTLRPQSTAVYSGAIRSAYLAERPPQLAASSLRVVSAIGARRRPP